MTRIFLSAGEPSGDLHGSNLVRALRHAAPDVELTGFGGPRMTAAGCDLLYPLCDHAVVGFARAAAGVATFARLLARADEAFRRDPPHAVVLIDYPGFHWWLARVARLHRIPVFYFVPPQLWAWAGWRVKKMKKLVDHVLCSLPFEVEWYRQRGVAAHYLGHPYFDELAHQQLNAAFVDAQRERGGTVVGLLPGSRWQELENNWPTLAGAAARIHAVRPDIRFLAACLTREHRAWVKARKPAGVPIDVHAGRTAEIIHLSRATVAVSGSVGLELLHRGTPSAVVYRSTRPLLFGARLFKTCKYISLVNLLADEELFPEFLSHKDESEAVAARLLPWLDDGPEYEVVRGKLADLKARVAAPGACGRAAAYLLDALAGPAVRRAA